MSFEERFAVAGRSIDRAVQSTSGRVKLGVGAGVLVMLIGVVLVRAMFSGTPKAPSGGVDFSSLAQERDRKTGEVGVPRPVRADGKRRNPS
jgi:hypothetical protein